MRLLTAMVLAAALNPVWAQTLAQQPDVVFVPTPQEVVDKMLEIANVRKGDVLYDLGSGDGRIPVTAAKRFGIRAVGIDIDPRRIEEANENARKNGVTELVTFKREDLFKTKFSDASVVTLYLLPDLNVKLRPRVLAELKPGTRIVSHQFDMGTWQPERKVELNGRVIYCGRFRNDRSNGIERREEGADLVPVLLAIFDAAVAGAGEEHGLREAAPALGERESVLHRRHGVFLGEDEERRGRNAGGHQRRVVAPLHQPA